jgi:polysaccharide biosynthesis protein PslG
MLSLFKCIFTAALTAALALLSSTAYAADRPRTVRESVGVNIHFTDPRPGEMDDLADAGMGWVRMDLGWGSTERVKGVYDFSHFDTLLSNLDKHHMRALLIFDYGSELYGTSAKPPFDDDGRAACARWAVAAVEHFKNRGVLWELWNEPNGDWFWPKHNAADYAKLALVVDKAIRDRFPREQLTGPATSTIDMSFLEGCFKAGCLNYWDAVSVHPYRQNDPETSATEYDALRKLIDQYAPKGKKIPIVSGEWGYSVAWGNFTDDRQAKYAAREFLVNLENGVPLSIWYDWHDDGADPKDAEAHFGLTRWDNHDGRVPVYDPKPSYIAVQTLTSTLGDAHFDRRLTIGDAAVDHVDAFAKGRERRYAAWTTSAIPHDVVVDVPKGAYDIVNWQGGRRRVVVDKAGLSITVSDMPQYVVSTRK